MWTYSRATPTITRSRIGSQSRSASKTSKSPERAADGFYRLTARFSSSLADAPHYFERA
jgi:hypothetical protein